MTKITRELKIRLRKITREATLLTEMTVMKALIPAIPKAKRETKHKMVLLLIKTATKRLTLVQRARVMRVPRAQRAERLTLTERMETKITLRPPILPNLMAREAQLLAGGLSKEMCLEPLLSLVLEQIQKQRGLVQKTRFTLTCLDSILN